MRNRQRFAFGVVVAGICLVLAGCGGGGVSQDEFDALQAELDAAEAARQQAEADRQQAEEDRQQAEAAEANARAGVVIGELDAGTHRTAASVTWRRGQSLNVVPGGGSFTSGSGAPPISGFRSHSFARQSTITNTVVDDTAYIYTNIQSPGTKAFWKVYGATVGIGDADWVATLAKPASFGNDRWLYQDAQGAQEDAADVSRSGTYRGASGRFECATSCNIQANAQGALTFAGTWTFTPNSPTTGVTLTQDEEYLYFGIWYSTPSVASAAHDFNVIYGGSPAYATVDVVPSTGVAGTATFSGGAIGRYVTRNQVGQAARIGTFTADAKLDAVFGGTPTLAGQITNFREGGSDLSGWSVTLGSTGNAATPAAFGSGTVTDGAVAASIGGAPATGEWDATLYGTANSREGTWTDASHPHSQYPTADLAGIAGHFEASNVATAANADVAIAGAFAATPD